MKVDVVNPNILFITTSSNCDGYRKTNIHHSLNRSYPTPISQCYLIDSLLYGLRDILAGNVIDYPKLTHMYSTDSVNESNNYYGNRLSFSTDLIDAQRRNVSNISKMIDEMKFDIIVYSDIHHRYMSISIVNSTYCYHTLKIHYNYI